MKVLFVCGGNSREEIFSLENYQPFVFDQRQSLIMKGIDVNVFTIKGRGFIGYLRNLPMLRNEIALNGYRLVHAHFGLAGMLSVLQKLCPVVTTFQGSDINLIRNRFISKAAVRFSAHNIFVENKLCEKANVRRGFSIIPYGVDLEQIFVPMDKVKCRNQLGLSIKSRIGLFCASFSRSEKNFGLAKSAIDLVGNLRIMELQKNYTRTQVNMLLNACDFVLMTSVREGSPQLIKEAMACNCPIVSTDVGDVRAVIRNTEGCYITSFDPRDVAEKIELALRFGKRTEGRQRIDSLHLGTKMIADRIIDVYSKVSSNKPSW